jgi:hypothetical protein
MTLARRFVVLAALMFWLGGFTFYASIVVPIGTRVLQSSRRQGFITREVTADLNRTAAACLAILALDVLLARDPSRLRWWTRAGLFLVMAGCQIELFFLHDQLDALLQPRGGIVLDPETFRPGHRLYLWVHTGQWFAGWTFVALTLRAWQVEDRPAVGVGK